MSEPQTLSYESSSTAWNGIAIGTIAIRLLGLYFIATVLPALSFLAINHPGAAGSPFSSVAMALVPGLTYAAVGILLIWLSIPLARWLFGNQIMGTISGSSGSTSDHRLQAIAFSVIGLYMMASALPQCAWLFYYDFGHRTVLSSRDWIVPVGAFVIGLILFLQSKALSRLWHRLRGTPAPMASIPSDADHA